MFRLTPLKNVCDHNSSTNKASIISHHSTVQSQPPLTATYPCGSLSCAVKFRMFSWLLQVLIRALLIESYKKM